MLVLPRGRRTLRLPAVVVVASALAASCSLDNTTKPGSSRSTPSGPTKTGVHFDAPEYDLAVGVGTLLVRVDRPDTVGTVPFDVVWSSTGNRAMPWSLGGYSLYFSSGQRSVLVPIGWDSNVPSSGGLVLRLEDSLLIGAPDSAVIRVTGQAPPMDHPIYFPLEVGNVWTYDKYEVGLGPDGWFSHETDRIVGTARFRGKDYAVLQQLTVSPRGTRTEDLYLRQDGNLIVKVDPADTASSVAVSYPWVVVDLGGSVGKEWKLYSHNNGVDDLEARAYSIGPAAVGGAGGISYRAWTTVLTTWVDFGDHDTTEGYGTTWVVQDSVGFVMKSDSTTFYTHTVEPQYWSSTAILRSHHAPGR